MCKGVRKVTRRREGDVTHMDSEIKQGGQHYTLPLARV